VNQGQGCTVHHGPQGHRHEVTEAWWHAHWSKASSRSGAQELTGVGRGRRGEDGESISLLTQVRRMMRWPCDGGEAAAAMELSGGCARARREGKRGVGGAVRRGGGHLLLYGVEGGAGKRCLVS
jgi:hypothetical protein